MLGPEYARTAVRDHFRAHLPGKLAELRARLGVDWPPPPHTIDLVDQINPDIALANGTFPLILISVHELAAWGKTSTGQNVGATWVCKYPTTVAVLVDSPKTGGYADADAGRDRFILAIRELLLIDAQLSEHAAAVLSPYTEESGPLATSFQGRVLAAAEIKFVVEVEEVLDSTAPPFTGGDTDIETLN